MNRQDSLRPVTRRALDIEYVSPGICAFPVAPSSGGSSGDSEAVIDFVTTTRLAGPSLTVTTYTSTTLRLEWSAIQDAAFYQVYRSDSPTGPFVFLQGPVGPQFYVDTPPSPGFWYYRVTAVEPNAGETEPSNVGSAEVPFPPPPVEGYKIWVGPESGKFSDTAGVTPATVGGEIKFWEDLSGLGNHLKFNSGSSAALNGPLNGPDTWAGRKAVVFGDDPASKLTGLITDDFLTISGGVTVFLVAAFRDPSVGSALPHGVAFTLLNGNLMLRQDSSGDKRWVTDRSTAATDLTDPTLAGTAVRLMGLRFNNAASNELELYSAGSEVANTTNVFSVGGGRVGLGFRSSILYEGFSGSVLEMVFYPSVLSDSEVAAVNEWLTQKHNL